MERRQLEYFLAIADAGSFTRAARVLTIAQPTLSHAVRTLEHELGSPLFERHGRGVVLTPAGEALVRPARRTLRAFAQAAGAVRGAAEDGFARLDIVTNTAWALDPLVRLLGELRQLRPGVRVDVTDPASRLVVVEQVRAGEADFGLLSGTPPGAPLASLHVHDLEVVAVLPPGAAGGVTLDVAVLVQHGLVATPPGTALREMLDDLLDEAGLDREAAVQTAHVATLVPLVLAGAGAAVLPEPLAVEAGARGARVVRLDPPRSADVHLVWHPDRLTDAGESLVAIAAELAVP